MKITVASTNEVKVNAVLDLLTEYEILRGAKVTSVKVASKVSEQPKSLAETISGAVNRAKAAFNGCDLSFGIESGLVTVPHTKTGMMDLCACVIYDGKEVHLGLSSAFECPPKVIHLVHSEGLDLNGAFHKIGLTNDPKIGNTGGAVGLLTRGRVDRVAYTKQAITMAMIHLENAEFYTK